MQKERCPLLEETRVVYCKSFPSKMIPLDKIKSASLCIGSYPTCPVYCELAREELVGEKVRGFQIKGNFLYHPGHTWACYESQDELRIGMDDFAQRLLGSLEGIEALAEGSDLGEMGKAWKVRARSREVVMRSPLDGVVLRANERVLSDPALVNRDPYGEGWILAVRPREKHPRGLLSGPVARKWLECEADKLHRAIESNLGVTLTDGGELAADWQAQADVAQWLRIVNSFLLTLEDHERRETRWRT